MKNAANKISKNEPAATPTVNRAAAAAHQAVDDISEKAEPIEKQVRETAARATEQIGASQSAAGERIENSIERLETFVKERPVAATGIAFAAGVLATALMRR